MTNLKIGTKIPIDTNELRYKYIELLELLITYYESKPNNEWTCGMMQTSKKECCAVGFTRVDFPFNPKARWNHLAPSKIEKILFKVAPTIIRENDGAIASSILHPKERTIKYLKDRIAYYKDLISSPIVNPL